MKRENKVATEMRLPQWAMGLQEGAVAQWLKDVGDPVKEGEPVALVDEAKVTDEILAPTAGYLVRKLVEEGQVVHVGTPLCLIGTLEELQSQAAPTVSPAAAAQPTPAGRSAAAAEAARPLHGKAMEVTPIARKLARDLGVDLATVTGSGPGGRVTEGDVRRAHEMLAAPRETEIRLSGMRGVVAQRMVASLSRSAQFTLHMQADVTGLLRQSEALNAGQGAVSGEVTLTHVLIKATALTLQKHPRMNGWVDDEKIRLFADIHIGLAVALEEGLIVPVLRNADRKTLGEIAEETRRLAQHAREKKLSADEISGSTFTITNLGMYGVESFTPIVNLPEIAVLGVGAVKEALSRTEDGLAWRKSLPLSLTIDHRAVDGAPAALFLRDLKNSLEQIDLGAL